LQYPIESYGEGQTFVMAVFLGFVIDMKKKNPYAPSALKLRFAIANSNKYIAMPASYSDDIMAIIGASNDVAHLPHQELLHEWEVQIKQNIVDRKIRHIISGNLLQAFSDFKGKLVSYTTNEGATKKGILMPENWISNSKETETRIVVPIQKALPLIKSMQSNTNVLTTNGISFFRTPYGYKMFTPSSRQKAGDIYLDKQLLELVDKNMFEKVSDKMVANIETQNIDEVVNILQQNHSLSVTVPRNMLDIIMKSEMKVSSRKQIELPTKEETPTINNNLLELEAEALMLELELAA
jgi:hypothetical protein